MLLLLLFLVTPATPAVRDSRHRQHHNHHPHQQHSGPGLQLTEDSLNEEPNLFYRSRLSCAVAALTP